MTIVEAMKGKTNKSGTIVDALKETAHISGVHTIKDAYKEIRKINNDESAAPAGPDPDL